MSPQMPDAIPRLFAAKATFEVHVQAGDGPLPPSFVLEPLETLLQPPSAGLWRSARL
jgi:hypothetical protein